MSTPTHPIQLSGERTAEVPQVVSLRAYEVYCEVFGPQSALVTQGCRGGFGAGELIAFLYAHSFPKEQWNDRMKEAFKGQKNL